MPGPFEFIVAGLAVWRITHLLAEEDGPAAIIARVRSRIGNGVMGSLVDCFACLSIWIAAAGATLVAVDFRSWFLCWLALSGFACLLERATTRQGVQP